MSNQPTQGRCRHAGTWIMAGGFIEWCYMCGAIRKMVQLIDTNGCYPETTWVRPTGSKSDNPYRKMRDRRMDGIPR